MDDLLLQFETSFRRGGHAETVRWKRGAKKMASLRLRYVSYLLAIHHMIRGESTGPMFWGDLWTLPMDDVNAASLYCFGMIGDSGESRTTRFFLKNIGDATVFYDIGA